MSAPFRRPPSAIEFIPDVWRILRDRPRGIGPVELADLRVQLLDLPPVPPPARYDQPELTLAEMLDIRTYDRRIAARRFFGDPAETRGRAGMGEWS